MRNNAKTFWPYAIILSIVAIVIACIATIVIALKNPVQMDNFYMDRYQNVDENITDIMDSQRRFDEKFDVKFIGFKGENLRGVFEFIVSSKRGETQEIQTQILLTKPETNEFNQNLKPVWQKQNLTTQSVILAKQGRWQLFLKLNDGSDTGFYKFDFNATSN